MTCVSESCEELLPASTNENVQGDSNKPHGSGKIMGMIDLDLFHVTELFRLVKPSGLRAKEGRQEKGKEEGCG